MAASEAPVVEYRISPQVSSEDLDALFAGTPPGRPSGRGMARILSQSLGYVCAYRAGELVGFVNVAWDGGAHAFLLDPTVRKDCRRKGIGVQLVRHAERLARDRGAEWLHVDFEPGLERFYRRCGFRPSRAGLIDLTNEEQRERGPSSHRR